MSLIHRHYKYDTSFRVNDSIASVHNKPPLTVSTSPRNLQSELSVSARNLVSINSLPDQLSAYYLKEIKSAQNFYGSQSLLSSFSLKQKPTAELSISELYHPDKPSGEFPKFIPFLSQRRINLPGAKLSLIHNPEHGPAVVETEPGDHSGLELESSVHEARSPRTMNTKSVRKPKLDSYLDMLHKTDHSSLERRWKQKLRGTVDLNNQKNQMNKDQTSLDFNAQYIKSLFPAPPAKKTTDSLNRLDFPAKDRLGIARFKESRKPSDVIGSINLDGIGVGGGTLGATSNEALPLPIQTKKSIGVISTIFKFNSNSNGNGNNNMNNTNNTSNINNANIITHNNGILMKNKMRTSLTYQEHQALFRDIAFNLHEIYAHNQNEQRFLNILNMLSDKNGNLVKLMHAKSHKVYDYDPVKLENKFAMIEFVYENLTIPQKLQKKKDGIILCEPTMLADLTVFCQKLEDYNVRKKREALKMVEYGLQETKQKIEVYREKKASEYAKQGKIKKFMENLKYDNPLKKPKPEGHAIDLDPKTVIEKYQRNILDYKHLRRPNLEYAVFINGIYNEWANQG